MRRKKSFVRISLKWLFVGFLPIFIVSLCSNYSQYHSIVVNRDAIVASFIFSPLSYFGIPLLTKEHKEVCGLFRQANWIQRIILGVFAFLIFGRIIRMIIQTFNQS